MDPRSNIFAGDVSNEVRPRYGHMAGLPKALVIHHTGGRGDVHGVANTFNQRGFPAHYVIDRDGQIYKTLPDGERGAHIRNSSNSHLSNADTVGVEVIGNDDRDVTPQQIEAAKRLHGYLSEGNPGLKVYGHGEINAHKMVDEGRTIAMALRNNQESGLPRIAGDTRVMPASARPEDRTLLAYQAAQQGVTTDEMRRANQPYRVASNGPAPVPVNASVQPSPASNSIVQKRDYLGAPPLPQQALAPYRPAAPAPVELGAGRNAVMTRGANSQYAALEQKYGLPSGYLSRTANIETLGGKVHDRAGSQYHGEFQMGANERRTYGADAEGAARYAVHNRDILRHALGREPTGAELYLAHNQGAGGASKLLSHPNAAAGSVANPRFISSNNGDPRAPASQFIQRYADKFNGGPAPVSGAPASAEDRAAPKLEKNMGGAQVASNAPLPPQRPATTLLDHLNPVSSAQARPMPESATLPRIDPADPSGPLRDRPPGAAPVQSPVATPEQLAAPKLDPIGTGSSFQDAAARMRGMGFGGYGPGINEMDSIHTAFGDSARKGDMLPETPYAVTMAGSQQYLQNAPAPVPVQQLPPIDVGAIPQGPGNGYQPATPGYAPMTPDPTQYQPIQTPLSTPAVDPAAFPEPAPVDLPSTDPGPTFTPDAGPSMGDSMPSVGGEGGAGGGMGDMFAGLADALGNLGGGGEGGAGGQMPNPTSGGPGALGALASVPDFPRIGDQYAALLNQRGAQVDAPIGLPQTPTFNLKQIGQAGQQPDQSMEGFARPATKRLFTA